MADSLPLVDAAIAGRLGTVLYSYRGGGTAMISGSVGVYNTLAVQQTTTPYLVFQLQSGIDDYAFGDKREESLDYVVKAVSVRSYPSHEANPIYETAHDALQDAPISVAGYGVMRVRRTSRVRYRDSQGYWHVGGLYRIDLTKS